jgi:hypothetical protein
MSVVSWVLERLNVRRLNSFASSLSLSSPTRVLELQWSSLIVATCICE